MRVIDRTSLVKKHPGKWIAFRQDCRTVLAVGDSANDVLRKAQSQGYQKPVLSRMPRQVMAFVGSYHRTS